MAKRKVGLSISSIIIILSLLFLFFWTIAKSVGWINTPVWNEMSPVFAAVFAAGGFYWEMKNITCKVDKIEGKVENMNKNITNLEKSIGVLEYAAGIKGIKGFKTERTETSKRKKRRG